MAESGLKTAVEQGLVSAEQAARLAGFLAPREAAAGQSGSEPLRFARSFDELFIAAGALLFNYGFIALHNLLEEQAQSGLLLRLYYLLPLLCCLVMSELLMRKRHSRLVGVALVIVIVTFVMQLVKANIYISYEELRYNPYVYGLTSLVLALYYWRYRIPFAALPITLGLMAALLTSLGFDPDTTYWPLMIYGAGVLALAMWLDSRDLQRRGWQADTALWAHLAAAFLLLAGIGRLVLDLAQVSPAAQLLVLAVAAAFMLGSLLIDRRMPACVAICWFVYYFIENFDYPTIPTMVFAGLVVVAVGVFWARLRHGLYHRLGSPAVARWVPPFDPPDKEA